MANICTECTTRYATGLAACPQCGGAERVDEHEHGQDEAVTRPAASKRKASAAAPKEAAPDGEAAPPTE